MKYSEYLEMLTESTKSTLKDPTIEEMRKFLKTKLKVYAPDATEDDTEVAIYWYASDYHSGQDSNLYSALSQSEYRPGRIENGIEKDSVAYDLYQELESKYGKEEKKEISESDDGDFVTSIVHLVTEIGGKKVEIYIDLPENMSQDKADRILTATIKKIAPKSTKEQVEKELLKAFAGSKLMKTEPDFGYTTYKKYIKESKQNNEFSEDDIKALKKLKFKLSSDNSRATIDIFGEKTVERIIVISPADFGNVDVKIVRHMNDEDSLYEIEDVSLEEIKKNIPAVVEELQALVKAEIDFDNVWARF